MSSEADAIQVLDAWYAGLDLFKDRLPAKGSILAALHVLERLRTKFDLAIETHVAEGQSQIKGQSAKSIAKVLAAFGEHRKISKIGGRSNRGVRGDINELLSAMMALDLKSKTPHERDDILAAMQRYIVMTFVVRYFKVQRVKASFDPACATSRFIGTILANARLNGKAGPVAEHLVGAKLTLTFPDIPIRNKPTSASDTQSGHEGDFEIGSTVFHVTVAPMPELFEKLKDNLDGGKRVYLLVPDSHVIGARQNSDLLARNRIAVESIESFVATNIDEQICFDAGMLKSGLRKLIDIYNSRVSAVETDLSLLIDMPANLQ